MKRLCKRLLILPILLSVLISCSQGGALLLCESLFDDYTANVSYTIKGEGDVISGTASVTRDDGLTLELLSPDIFGGIKIRSDDDSPQTISFSYYGIDTKLPSGSLSKINLFLSLFSDKIPSRLSSPGGSERSRVDDYTVDDRKIDTAYLAKFTHDDIEYSIIYDSITGIPYEMSATSDICSVVAKFLEFVPEKD